MFVFGCKINTFYQHFKVIKTFRCYSFTIILNLSSHIAFSLQIVSIQAFLRYNLKEG